MDCELRHLASLIPAITAWFNLLKLSAAQLRMIKPSNTRQYMTDKMPDMSTWLFIIYGAWRQMFKSQARAIFLCLFKNHGNIKIKQQIPQLQEAVSAYCESSIARVEACGGPCTDDSPVVWTVTPFSSFFPHQNQVEIKPLRWRLKALSDHFPLN